MRAHRPILAVNMPDGSTCHVGIFRQACALRTHEINPALKAFKERSGLAETRVITPPVAYLGLKQNPAFFAGCSPFPCGIIAYGGPSGGPEHFVLSGPSAPGPTEAFVGANFSLARFREPRPGHFTIDYPPEQLITVGSFPQKSRGLTKALSPVFSPGIETELFLCRFRFACASLLVLDTKFQKEVWAFSFPSDRFGVAVEIPANEVEAFQRAA